MERRRAPVEDGDDDVAAKKFGGGVSGVRTHEGKGEGPRGGVGDLCSRRNRLQTAAEVAKSGEQNRWPGGISG